MRSHLQDLEAEAIHIFREAYVQAVNPALLYSIGKDSSVLLHLARKAFAPAQLPFPLLHIDTLWKFKEMYTFRERVRSQQDLQMFVYVNPEGVRRNINPFVDGSRIHTDIMKTQALKQALNQHKFDVAFGGARRDEESSRAKERIFSFRNIEHHWDAKNQRPELWQTYNALKHPGESIRVFPLSNWTEQDIWLYVEQENLELVPLYYAAERPVVVRDGFIMMADDKRIQLLPNEKIESKRIRFRTLGCFPLTGAIESNAETPHQVLKELEEFKWSERHGRTIDTDELSSLEQKKQEGYF